MPEPGWTLVRVSRWRGHRPVRTGGAPAGQAQGRAGGLPVLPPYVRRKHDRVLGQVVARGCGRRSGIAVLVGGSSTGKTRACWEALESLRDQNAGGGCGILRPDPPRGRAAPNCRTSARNRRVVERDPAVPGRRAMSRRTGRGRAARAADGPRPSPVLVLATLWPNLNTLPPAGQGSDPRPQARAGGRWPAQHSVPAAFAGGAALPSAVPPRRPTCGWPGDRSRRTRRTTQFLAGGPALLARFYRKPRPPRRR